MDKQRIQSHIYTAFKANSLLPTWGLAIAEVESSFNPDATNLTGGDGRRGGSYGLFQLSCRTAQGLGYKGSPEGLLEIPVNISYAVKLIKQLIKTNPSLEEVASRYNSGKPLSKAPESTVQYVKKIVSAEARWRQKINTRN